MSEMTIKQSTSIADLGSQPTVLGTSKAAIPVTGHIRPGIMVLTKDSMANDKAVKIYMDGLDRQESFKKIATNLYKALGDEAKLTPKNADYFTARPSDFADKRCADFINQKYGEDRGHGRKLYRFPVIFPLDNWQAVMPHQFSCYTASERKYWSEYDDKGNRFCMMHEPVKMNRGKAQRIAGGRKPIKRPDNDGVCNPDSCPEYQQRKCTLSGRFIFYIPEMPGAGAVDLPTGSIYSMLQARQIMEMVSYITGGRISGTFDGKPIFYFTKSEEEVSMIDEKTGKAKKQKQILIKLNANVNMTDLFKRSEVSQRLENGQQAAEALEYMDDDSFDGQVVETEHAAENMGATPDNNPPEQTQETVNQAENISPEQVVGDLVALIDIASTIEDLMEVAKRLNEIKDAKERKQVQQKMSSKHAAIEGES